ncbi:MAG: nuclear transport factor 2 family protein [Methylibium sp.]|uniref:nuclear transport factor 2 family protein n=1 Tax=Methylibium sp. TaxID=2067992 RepID=UPI0017E80653|nr:nuclear transport factor 2 family protein [Methylibium sp.]MBA3597262.1 nuclear transport factor 2 family protein [Methylibium sp.]
MSNPVRRFFACLAENNVSAALALVSDDAVFEAQGPDSIPIYGRFEGEDGVRRFLAILAEMFETQAFEIRQWSATDDFVFAYGYMQRRVRSTGRIFECEWALVCRVAEGRIKSYKMFEDTAALHAACAAAAT